MKNLNAALQYRNTDRITYGKSENATLFFDMFDELINSENHSMKILFLTAVTLEKNHLVFLKR